MWIIARNALRERLRRKELYLIVAVGIFILLLCSSGTATISIEGEPVTSFSNMFLVLHTVMNGVGCLLAAVLSVRTIPDEYERRNSHLVWVRGISQERYHAGLSLANVLSAVIAMGLLYLALAIYVIANGHVDYLLRMVVAFLMVSLNMSLVSLFVSVLSIKLPVMAVGVLGVAFACGGILHGVLGLYQNIVGGTAGRLVFRLLLILPDLHGIQMQAQRYLTQETVDVHLILVGLLTLYVVSLGLLLFKKREA